MCQVFAGQDPERYTSTTRRLRLNGQSTSLRLENAFWVILDQISEADGVSTPAFISKLRAEVLETQGEPVNFTSLLRTACLVFMAQSNATDHHDGSQSIAAE